MTERKRRAKRATIKQTKEFRDALVTLTQAVQRSLREIDVTMRLAESVERGKKIAAIANELEMANDRIRFFVLDVDWRKPSSAHTQGQHATRS